MPQFTSSTFNFYLVQIRTNLIWSDRPSTFIWNRSDRKSFGGISFLKISKNFSQKQKFSIETHEKALLPGICLCCNFYSTTIATMQLSEWKNGNQSAGNEQNGHLASGNEKFFDERMRMKTYGAGPGFDWRFCDEESGPSGRNRSQQRRLFYDVWSSFPLLIFWLVNWRKKKFIIWSWNEI